MCFRAPIFFAFNSTASKSSFCPQSTVKVMTSTLCKICKYLTHTEVSSPPENAKTTFSFANGTRCHLPHYIYNFLVSDDIYIKALVTLVCRSDTTILLKIADV